MNAKIILSLYNEKYTFIEKLASKDKRYTDNLSKCISIEEKLEKILDVETYSLVEKLI